MVTDLNAGSAIATAAEFGNEGRAIGLGMDVTDEKQVEFGMQTTVRIFGGIDILVSNAGIQTVAPLDQLKFANWKQLLSIHLDGAFLTTRAALNEMYRQKRGGSIIYMGWPCKSSGQGRRSPWRAGQCDMPRLCAHASGGKADSRAGQGTGNF